MATIIEEPSLPARTRSGSAVPPSTGEIHFGTPTTPAAPAAPATPAQPKPSARENIFADLRSRARGNDRVPSSNAPASPTVPAVPPAAPAAPEPEGEEPVEPQPEPEEIDLGEDTRPAAPPATPAPAPETTPPAPAGKKPSPWKLVEEYKTKLAKAETDLVEARKLVPNEVARKQELEQLEAHTKRNKELEDAIKFYDYSKSREFQEKYQAPFNSAWEKAAADLAEMTVVSEEGTERAATVSDITDIINLPLARARKLAVERFGDFADDIMAHRKTIVDLYGQQQQALKEAQTNGESMMKQRHEQMMQHRQAIQQEMASHWTHYNQAISKDKRFGRFFTPQDGDDEGNKSLEKGYQMIDMALAANPMDPRLSPEQRKEAVRLHSAVRNRAAAFGRMARMIETKDARIKELESRLSSYQGSEPEAGGTNGAPTAGAPATTRDSVFAALHKLAK